MSDNAVILKHATKAERRVLNALAKHGSERKAAKALGIGHGTVSAAVRRARRRAALRDPGTHGTKAPEGFRIPKSTVHIKDGEVVQQWIRYGDSGDDPGAVLEAFRAALADDFPRYVPILGDVITDADLMCVYPWGDPHFGMLAWAPEAGDDYDLEIAERHHCAAIDSLVERAPRADVAVFANVGDASHADSGSGMTTAGTRVDVDSRYPKVQRVIIRTWVYAIKRMLTKHRKVYVYNAIGNHDTNTSTWISLCLEAYFHDEPRVIIDPGVTKFQHHEFGKCFIGITHGDTCAPKDLGGVMLVKWPDALARTTFRYWITGHIHHETKKEFPGYIVESYRTVAPKDSWHAGKGYMSGQSMVMDVLHKERGRIERHEIGIEEIKAAS